MLTAPAVLSILETYRKEYGDVKFMPDRYKTVFGNDAEISDDGWNVADMTDMEIVQIALLDFVARTFALEDALNELAEQMAQQQTSTPNRATRRSKK